MNDHESTQLEIAVPAPKVYQYFCEDCDVKWKTNKDLNEPCFSCGEAGVPEGYTGYQGLGYWTHG